MGVFVIHLRRAALSEIEWINRRYDEVQFVHSDYNKEVIAIAELDGQPVGLGRLVSIDGKTAELGGIYVFEGYRNRGIAKRIVAFLLEQRTFSSAIYCIPFENLTPFYRRYGFELCEKNESIPKEILEKYLWCKKQYPQPTSLLLLRR